jgi:hypothetical protein
MKRVLFLLTFTLGACSGGGGTPSAPSSANGVPSAAATGTPTPIATGKASPTPHASATPSPMPSVTPSSLPAGSIALNIVNASAYKNPYVYIVGLGTDGNWYRVTSSGALAQVQSSDAVGGYANYSIPVPASGLSMPLPQLSGARMYVSLGAPLKIAVSGSGVPNSPPGWVASDPNYDILFDWVEFTYNSSGWNGNTTAVDMFGLPLQIALNGSSGTQTVGTLPGGRTAVMNGLESASGWSGTVITGPAQGLGTTLPLRAIAPFHAIDNGTFDAHYLDAYIASVWSKYASQPLTMNTSAWGTYTGQVVGGALQFTQPGQTTISFDEPSTYDVFANAGTLAAQPCGGAPSTSCLVQGQMANALSGAWNRSTLGIDSTIPACTSSEFYTTIPTNDYAKYVHANSVRGLAYGFGFDDSCDFSSFIADRAPTSVTITIEPF